VGVGVALPYPTINLVGSALFLATCGFAYSLLGTLNFAGMSVRADTLAGRPAAGQTERDPLRARSVKNGDGELARLLHWGVSPASDRGRPELRDNNPC